MLRSYVAILALVTGLMLIGRPARADDWEQVESKEGGFTIEMPSKPTINKSRNRKIGNDEVKTTLIGCTTNFGIYYAQKIVIPTAIVKGSEDAELDAERDDWAQEWNGKVIDERKVRADNKIGRDFTIRGNPDKKRTTLTIRVREYLSENSIYVVAVMSLPNRELPDDTGRFLGSLTINGKRAEGTTSPELKGADLSGWGVMIDPVKECEYTALDKNRLQMKIIGSKHQNTTEGLNSLAPRVLREVEGDFTVTVKVTGDFRPGGRSTNPKAAPWIGAGILVVSDADNFIRLERAAVNRNGKVFPYVNFEEFEGGAHGVTNNETMQGGDCWIRMDRKGSKIYGSVSFDGKKWKELKPIQTVWPAKLKIGLQASTSSGILPVTVVFEEYDLKAVKAKKVD